MRGISFDAVLDAALAQAASDAAADVAAKVVWGWRSEPPLGSAFLFARPLTTAHRCWPAGEVQPPRQPAHRLTDVQRVAFEGLVTLGAALSDSFTAEDLRTQYRELARRFHPDGYTQCSGLEQAQRARCFVEAAEHYRCLREVVESRH